MRRLAWLMAVLMLASCGYTTRSLVSEKSSTIAVPVFDNVTRRRDLEWEITRAVVEEIHSRTHLRVVDLSDSPDLILVGSLVDVDELLLSKRRRQRLRESAVLVTAEIEVKGRTGDVVLEKRRVTERESFTPFAGEDVRTAREEAVRTLAERIVRELETGW